MKTGDFARALLTQKKTGKQMLKKKANLRPFQNLKNLVRTKKRKNVA